MTDIVERLRDHGDRFPIKNTGEWIDFASLYLVEAADEIERLRGGMLKMASAMSTQVETIERLRAQARKGTLDCLAADGQAADLIEENAKLRAALKDARVSVEGWADYASDYIKEKWDLKGDLARIDAALGGE